MPEIKMTSRTKYFLDDGWEKVDGWDSKCPNILEWGGIDRHGWVDHFFMLIKGNETIYVSEPYQLYDYGMENLLLLSSQGWDVYIDGSSEWYPGWTLHIEVKRKEISSA